MKLPTPEALADLCAVWLGKLSAVVCAGALLIRIHDAMWAHAYMEAAMWCGIAVLIGIWAQLNQLTKLLRERP